MPIPNVKLANISNMTLTVDKFGRILIPKTLRQLLMIEPGDELEVDIDTTQPILTLSPKKDADEIRVELTDWGFPILVGGAPYPEDFDPAGYLKEGYEEYHRTRFGV